MMKKRGTIDTMKKILDLITEEMEQAFADAGYEKELAHFPTARIYVNISAMVRWQVQKSTTKHRS